MKKRFTEEQIIGFLREAEAGLAVAELCRRHGFSEASYYLWRSKFGGMSVSVSGCVGRRKYGGVPLGADRQMTRAPKGPGTSECITG